MPKIKKERSQFFQKIKGLFEIKGLNLQNHQKNRSLNWATDCIVYTVDSQNKTPQNKTPFVILAETALTKIRPLLKFVRKFSSKNDIFSGVLSLFETKTAFMFHSVLLIVK